MGTQVSILANPVPSRLQHNVKYSSMCSTTGPCWLSILKTAVYTRVMFFLTKAQQK